MRLIRYRIIGLVVLVLLAGCGDDDGSRGARAAPGGASQDFLGFVSGLAETAPEDGAPLDIDGVAVEMLEDAEPVDVG